jgi:cob(I)alamin adenosyltransferase
MHRLYKILSFRSLGFPLTTVARLLELDNGDALARATREHLEHVSKQLASYELLYRRLTDLLDLLSRSREPSDKDLIEVMEVMSMTVHLSRIYTRTGDAGDTQLGDRTRTPKTDPRIEAYGDVDELSSEIGVAIATGSLSPRDQAWLLRIQNDLYDVGADLAVPSNDAQGKARLRIGPEYVRWLEEACDEANARLGHLKSFVIPGGSAGAAQLHVCRTVCRRAERHVLRVADSNPEVVRYLNRLSDLLFILARSAHPEEIHLWDPGQHAPSSQPEPSIQ